ncbi:MAG: hypothetical protein HOH43_25145 [Candidatus Latescibacteria bacterium]|jgi:hypothetical protein|nr:hypothetical protein [Candidatus Latescibacterota bacterium]
MPDKHAPNLTESPDTPVSLRAGFTGLFLAVVVSVWGQFAPNTLGYDVTYAQLPPCLLLPFLVLILGPNLVLRRMQPARALRRAELGIVFLMGWVSSMVPHKGMTTYLLSVITAPHSIDLHGLVDPVHPAEDGRTASLS